MSDALGAPAAGLIDDSPTTVATGDQQAAASSPAQPLPPKARFIQEHKRKATEEASAVHSEVAIPIPPRGTAPVGTAGGATQDIGRDPALGCSVGGSGSGSGSDREDDGDVDPLRRGPKQQRLLVSKIQGLAEPRKPRIGPQYQAVVPQWPSPDPPPPARPQQ